MTLSRKHAHLLLVFLFLLVQGMWLVHSVEHEMEPPGEQHVACHLCLAGHGLGGALTSQLPDFAAPVLDYGLSQSAPVFPHFLALLTPRQRGPPVLT